MAYIVMAHTSYHSHLPVRIINKMSGCGWVGGSAPLPLVLANEYHRTAVYNISKTLSSAAVHDVVAHGFGSLGRWIFRPIADIERRVDALPVVRITAKPIQL